MSIKTTKIIKPLSSMATQDEYNKMLRNYSYNPITYDDFVKMQQEKTKTSNILSSKVIENYFDGNKKKQKKKRKKRSKSKKKSRKKKLKM